MPWPGVTRVFYRRERIRAGGIVWVPVNLLDADSIEELADLVARIEQDPALTVVVFDSANPDLAMLADLSKAYALLESDDELRAGVLFAHGEHFTAGLDLVDVAPALASGQSRFRDDGRDPWRRDGMWAKPIVAAAQGWSMSPGIELLLAADVRVAGYACRGKWCG